MKSVIGFHLSLGDLIKHYPDEIVRARRSGLTDMPMSELLKKYIPVQNELVAECQTGEGVYSYEYFSLDDGYWIEKYGFEKIINLVANN